MSVNHHTPLLSLVLAVAVTVLLWVAQVSADVQAVGWCHADSNCSTQSIRIKGDTLGRISIDVRCMSFYSYGPKGHACRATDGTCKQCDSVDHGQICLHNGPYYSFCP